MEATLIFKSPYANMIFNIRDELVQRHPVTGDIIEKTPPVVAEFGQHLGEYKYVDPQTGMEEIGAEIRGNYFDTDAAAVQHGWDKDVKEMVERHLLHKCDEVPEFISLYSAPAATRPWPTYDQMANYLKIATLAADLGLIDETLAYERQNKNRDGVIAELEKRKTEATADDELVAA